MSLPFPWTLAPSFIVEGILAVPVVGSIIVFHPMVTFALCYLVWMQWKLRQPWPKVPGTKVKEIASMTEWKETLAASKVVVVDCFAVWCMPCKQCAVPYGELSKEVTQATFTAVNVDEAPDVAGELGVTAMPTFKVFVQGACVETVVGARVGAVRDAVVKALQ